MNLENIQFVVCVDSLHNILGWKYSQRTECMDGAWPRCIGAARSRTLDIYRVSQEEGTKPRESVPYVKIYRYNPKHLYPKLNGYGDNGQRKVWSSGGSTHCTLSADSVPHICPRLPCQITEIPLTLLRQYSTMADYACHV